VQLGVGVDKGMVCEGVRMGLWGDCEGDEGMGGDGIRVED